MVKHLICLIINKRYIPVIFSTVAVMILVSTTNSYSTISQTWTTGASMPTARTEVAGAALDGKIYIAGGFDETGNRSDVFEVYDPEKDTWSRASSLPERMDHTAIVPHNGKLYLVGGYTGIERTSSNRLYAYDPSTDKWQQLKSMPTGRGALTANFIDGILYVVGGDLSGKTMNTNEAYNPQTDTWIELQPMPTKRHHLTSAVVDGKLYVVGGRNTDDDPSVNLDTNEVYDPNLDKWTSIQSMPTKRSGLSATSFDDKIYVFGGEYPFDAEPKRTFNNTEIYQPTIDNWTLGSPLPTARHGLAAIGINNTIYVIGGGPDAGLTYSHANEILRIK